MTQVRDVLTGSSGRWVGTPYPRVEDEPLLRGAATFVADLQLPRMVHARFVRATVAAANLEKVDVGEAAAIDGVVAVLTHEDLAAASISAVMGPEDFAVTEMPVLADGLARHAGEPIALVLATDPYIAEDAADRVEVIYGSTTPLVTIEDALASSFQLHQAAPGNVLVDVLYRDDPDLDRVLAAATTVVEESFTTGRLTASPMECRGVVASWDASDGRLTMWTSTQVPHVVRSAVAQFLNMDEGSLRVIAPSVGGGFGQKCAVAAEEIAIAAACRLVRRPVKWVEDRQENLTSAFQGHEQEFRVRVGFDEYGHLLGVDADILSDAGAYSAYPFTGAVEALMAANELLNAYKVDHYRVRTRAVLTTKPPVAPYRGVARPQTCFVMERVMDLAAAALGVDRVEIRRQNLVSADDFPYTSLTGATFDEGTYVEALDLAAERVGYAGFAERRAEAAAVGRRLGVGFSCFNEITGYGSPLFGRRRMGTTPSFELAELVVDPTGGVRLTVGASAHGQGHRTVLAQVAADGLGVSPDVVRVRQGDTDALPYGWGTFASRGAVVSGGATARVARKMVERLRLTAAHLLHVPEDEVGWVGGEAIVVADPDRRVTLRELAHISYHQAHRLPAGAGGGLMETATFDPPGTFSNAAHAVVVEIDQGTGEVTILDYVVVEDCGVALNPQIVDGQVRGGVAQGIGAALLEKVAFTTDGAQPSTSTYVDYLVPTAAEIPAIRVFHLETPSLTSETGAKGMGEGPTIGAPAAVANAVADALGSPAPVLRTLPIHPAWIVDALGAA